MEKSVATGKREGLTHVNLVLSLRRIFNDNFGNDDDEITKKHG